MEFHVHQFKFFITLFFTMPNTVVLSVCIGVGCFLCPIYSSECRAGMASLKCIYRDPSLTSAAKNITALIICAIVSMNPLFGGSGESLDMKKFPLALLL